MTVRYVMLITARPVQFAARDCPLAILQQRQERISRDSSRSNQCRNNVSPDFSILWDDQRPSDARLFQLYVATLLASLAIGDLFKHANYFVPRKRI
jgi:hypothetical protein